MTTLGLRDLGFVGGLGGGYTITDADALAWANNVASSDGVELPDAIKQALDTYVQALKPTGLGGAAGSIWSQAAQLLLPCGPLTLAGALRPLKGAAPTNGSGSADATQFTSGNYSRKNGLGDASNASKYLISNVATSVIATTSHAYFAYGSIPAYPAGSATTRVLVGTYDNVTAASLSLLQELEPQGAGVPTRLFRDASFIGSNISAGTAANFMLGSRTASNSTTLYVDSDSLTDTTSYPSVTSSTRFLAYYGFNNNGTFIASSQSILQATGIFSTGLNATQAAALRTATATYVAAVAAAIP